MHDTKLSQDFQWHKMGNHITLDIEGLSFDRLNSGSFLEQLGKTAIEKSGATILETIRHYFYPQGVTILFLLEESHASIHTYPELGYIAFDFFTCGDRCNPMKSVEYVMEYLGKTKNEVIINNVNRGFNERIDT